MPSLTASRLRQTGLGLIEILVGMLIGMIGVVVIFSVLAIAEERKRSTGAGSDAQTSGAIALFSLERDVRQAGFGLAGMAAGFYNCPVSIYSATNPTKNFTAPLAPVRITHGTSDTITIWYGNSMTGPITKQFSSSEVESKTLVEGVGGLMEGDVVLLAGSVTGATGCPGAGDAVAMAQVSDVSDATGLVMEHAADDTLPFNRPGGPDVPDDFSAGFVFNLGQQPVIHQWSVSPNGTLQIQELLRGTPPVEVGESIISLQAQYGINTAAANATPVITWQDADPTAAQWPNVRAIRVAILTRSANWEREVVTPNAPRWYNDTNDTYVEFTMSNLADGTDWKNYRYRVFQTTIPLPNVVMGTGI